MECVIMIVTNSPTIFTSPLEQFGIGLLTYQVLGSRITVEELAVYLFYVCHMAHLYILSL